MLQVPQEPQGLQEYKVLSDQLEPQVTLVLRELLEHKDLQVLLGLLVHLEQLVRLELLVPLAQLVELAQLVQLDKPVLKEQWDNQVILDLIIRNFVKIGVQ